MDRTFYTAEDLAKILNRSENYCYKLIRTLNAELEKQGYITVRARIPAAYFYDRVLPCKAGGEKG